MRTIKILGAGISGLSAAINLAKSGFEVIVFDRASDCGQRFGGDIQGLMNYHSDTEVLDEIKKINISPEFQHSPFYTLDVCNNAKIWQFKSVSKPIGYLVKRGEVSGSIDLSLKKQALSSGVKIFFNQSVVESEVDIIATGPVMDHIDGAVKGIIFKTSHPDISSVLLDNSAAYHAYGYLLITGGYGCLCSMILKDLKNLNNYFENTYRQFNSLYKFDIKNPKNVSGIGSVLINRKVKIDNKLRVGEAAGLQDLLAGFGIQYALMSGYLAAKSIVNNENYEMLINQHLKNRQKATVVSRFIWDLLSFNNYYFTPRLMAMFKNPFSVYRQFYNFGLIQKILYPLAYSYVVTRYDVRE